MAYVTNNITAPSVFAGVAAVLGRAARYLAANSAGAKCAAEAQRLSRLSDAELAKMGLNRNGIVLHAFRNHIGG